MHLELNIPAYGGELEAVSWCVPEGPGPKAHHHGRCEATYGKQVDIWYNLFYKTG